MFSSKGLSVSRYRVLGVAASPKISQLGTDWQSFRAKKPRLQGATDEVSVGWDRKDDEMGELAASDSWDLHDCLLGDGLMLNIRIDKRRVPGALLRWLVKDKLAKIANRRDKPLSGKEQRQVMQQQKAELLALALPDIQYYQCFWNLKSHEVFLYSTSKAIIGYFEDIFFKSFCAPLDAQMVKVDPPLLAFNSEDWGSQKDVEKKIKKLIEVVPSQF